MTLALYLFIFAAGFVCPLLAFMWGNRIGAQQAIKRSNRDIVDRAFAAEQAAREAREAFRRGLRVPMASDTAIDAALSTPLEFTLDGEPLLPPSDPVADWHAEGGPVFADDDLD